jgi:hypothetical protein
MQKPDIQICTRSIQKLDRIVWFLNGCHLGLGHSKNGQKCPVFKWSASLDYYTTEFFILCIKLSSLVDNLKTGPNFFAKEIFSFMLENVYLSGTLEMVPISGVHCTMTIRIPDESKFFEWSICVLVKWPFNL